MGKHSYHGIFSWILKSGQEKSNPVPFFFMYNVVPFHAKKCWKTAYVKSYGWGEGTGPWHLLCKAPAKWHSFFTGGHSQIDKETGFPVVVTATVINHHSHWSHHPWRNPLFLQGLLHYCCIKILFTLYLFPQGCPVNGVVGKGNQTKRRYPLHLVALTDVRDMFASAVCDTADVEWLHSPMALNPDGSLSPSHLPRAAHRHRRTRSLPWGTRSDVVL